MTAFRPQLLQLVALCGAAFGLLAGTAHAGRTTTTNPSTIVVMNPTPIVVSAR